MTSRNARSTELCTWTSRWNHQAGQYSTDAVVCRNIFDMRFGRCQDNYDCEKRSAALIVTLISVNKPRRTPTCCCSVGPTLLVEKDS